MSPGAESAGSSTRDKITARKKVRTHYFLCIMYYIILIIHFSMEVGQKRKRGEDSGLSELAKLFAEADSREEKRMASLLEMEAKTREREMEMEARMMERDDQREERWFLLFGAFMQQMAGNAASPYSFPFQPQQPSPYHFQNPSSQASFPFPPPPEYNPPSSQQTSRYYYHGGL